LHAPLAFH